MIMRRPRLYDPCPRLRAIEPEIIGGERCWPLEAVCRAMHLNKDTVRCRIPREHKRLLTRERGRFRTWHYCYLTADGVEFLALHYGTHPISDIKAALEASGAKAKQGGD